VDPDYQVWVDLAENDRARDHFFRFQIIEAARQQKYFANTQTYRAWVRMVIRTDVQTDLLLSFHCLGQEFNGVMVCSPVMFVREETDQETREIAEITALSDSPFQFNYNDHSPILKTRLDQWLEEVLAKGLDRWRRSL
jgi:hypothetical protein